MTEDQKAMNAIFLRYSSRSFQRFCSCSCPWKGCFELFDNLCGRSSAVCDSLIEALLAEILFQLIDKHSGPTGSPQYSTLNESTNLSQQGGR